MPIELPPNKPLEWTGHHRHSAVDRNSLPATQGRHSKDQLAYHRDDRKSTLDTER
jgi:hypothetical protein